MRTAPLVALALGIVAPAGAAEPTLPTPPRQNEPWTPPKTGLPQFLVGATATLFGQGLADPRGCEYRAIRVAVGSVWGGPGAEVETRGWVLPSAPDARPTHAVAWSGLVYPLVDSGGPADLDADVLAFEDAAGDGRADGAPGDRRPRPTPFQAFGINNEASSVAIASPHPVKVCLLLRLGRADLAEAVWAAGTGRPKAPAPGERKPGPDLNSYGLSYLTLARDLAWYHFDRAVCAHMRADDALALADARFLDGFSRAVDARAEALGFERPDRVDPAVGATPYIDFLGPLPALRADQERRARERAAPPRNEGREDRIASLIRDLDQVAARQWGQPGGVVLGEAPAVKALIAEGDAAVGPLIRDFRTDDRLTRSVGFHRDFFRHRTILGADKAAFVALTGILRATNFAPPAPDGSPAGPRSRAAVADEIEAYWEKNRGASVVERWYRSLADDGAGAAAWLEAAANVTRPANVQRVPGGGPFVVTVTTPARPGESPPFQGESLRRGHEPTVSALLARRIASMLRTPEGQRFELLDPCRLAAIFAEWDPAAAVPTLRDLTRVCRERYARPGNNNDWPDQNLAVSIARFTLARDRAGDPGAVPEYADWVRTTAPDRLGQNARAVLEPLYRHPDDPTLAAAADWLFGDPRSLWVPLVGRKGARPSYHAVELIASPMVEVPAFRTLLLASLDDRSPAGKAEADAQGGVTVTLAEGVSMSRGGPGVGPDAPPAGTVTPIRTCDLFAWQLSTLKGAPAFHPCWDVPRRDAGVAAVADFLKRKGKDAGPPRAP